MMRGGIAGLIVLALSGSAFELEAQLGTEMEDLPSSRSSSIAVATPSASAIQIDGLDDEDAWRTAVPVTGFREFSPEQDADPSFATEFRVLYSEDELYFYVRAYDAAPDSVMRGLSRRDRRTPSDQIGIIIDSYNDRRTGFSFYVNPDGVLRDFAIFDDGNEDSSWNGVWEAAASVDSLGWAAEFRIPLSQLRYADADRHAFGFGVRRDIERYSERLSWPVFSRTTTGLVSQLGQLIGLDGLGSTRRLEFSPYFLTKNVTRAEASAPGFEHVQQASVGGDLKVGLGPNVTLDATVNPDFGQVEADPAVLNLSAFETFFSERRPFFVEGTGLYGFSLNCYIVVDCSTNEGLFYSRRIGRQPALDGLYGDATTPTFTPIRGALKLTGRRPGGLSFGVLDAVTGGVDGTDGRTVEPRTNYAVLRVEQDLRDGDAGIGWIATGVHRGLDEWSRPYLHESAYVTGVNARNRFGDRKYEVQGSFAASRVTGSAEAIERTQRSAAHYYQQPGDDLDLDPSRTSISGYTAQVKVGKYAGGITRFETSYVHQSGGFDPNDLGFLRRADVRDWSTWAALSFQDPTALYRWAQVNGNTWHHWNTSGTRLQASVNFNAHMGLHNNWNLHAGSTVSGLTATYCDRCTRGGPVLRQSKSVYPWFGVNGDNRKALVPGMWVNLGYWDEGESSSLSLNPYLEVRVSSSLRANIGGRYYRGDNDSQWFGNFTDSGGATHYTFARLDQRTVSLNARVNYTATPDLSFEFYAEPFASSGTYADVREVVAPSAASHPDRYAPYVVPAGTATAFSARQLRTNAVLRWEYRPGSTLFLVWAHGREAYVQDEPRRAWHDDFSDLLGLHPDNTFLIKVSYWFNR
jgi:hypothetical protein